MQRGCVVKVTSTADRAVVSVEALLYGDGYGYGYGDGDGYGYGDGDGDGTLPTAANLPLVAA